MVNTTGQIHHWKKFLISSRNKEGPILNSLNPYTIVFKWVWICLWAHMLEKACGENILWKRCGDSNRGSRTESLY